MKKIVFAVMAFALFAGLVSCDKKESMKELTIETSLLGDTVAQFTCTFSPTVSNGYFAFYTGDRISAERWDEAFESRYGIYETFNESKTLYSYWLTAGHTYYLYAMTFKEEEGKATLIDVAEVRFSTPPSNDSAQALDAKWNKDEKILSIAAPTGYDESYIGKWMSDTICYGQTLHGEYDYYTISVSLENPRFCDDKPDKTILVGDDNKFKTQIYVLTSSLTYNYTASIPVNSGGYDVFTLKIIVNAFVGMGKYETIQYDSPISPVLPGDGPTAF